MERKISLKRAGAIGSKDTVAIILISQGVEMVQKGEYLIGGILVIAGGVLLVVDQVIQ